MSCPNCPCADCVASRVNPEVVDYGAPGPAYGRYEWDECAYVRVAREAAAKGQPPPNNLLLYYLGKRCNPICF